MEHAAPVDHDQFQRRSPHEALAPVQMVGPLLASSGKPLAEDLLTFLTQMPAQGSDQALKNRGAVFVSMGTAVRLTEAEARGMATNLAAIKRPVLWKISDMELPGETFPTAR